MIAVMEVDYTSLKLDCDYELLTIFLLFQYTDQGRSWFFLFRGGGTFASGECTRHVGGCGGILPQKIVKFGGSETLFSALVMRYVSVKRQVFSVLTAIFLPRSC